MKKLKHEGNRNLKSKQGGVTLIPVTPNNNEFTKGGF
jgi:hypothetical protein